MSDQQESQTLEEQMNYVLTFGKFKGSTLGALAGDRKGGRSYLEWMVKQDFHEKFLNRISGVLQEIVC